MDEQQKPEIEDFASDPLFFDRSSIPPQLYENDPEQARSRIIEGLERQQQALQKKLIEQGIHQDYIETLREIQEKYATEAMRADLLIAKHPEFADVARIAYSSTSSRSREYTYNIIDEVANSFKEYEKKAAVKRDMSLYYSSVETSTIVRLARPQDLKAIMSSDTISYPNIKKNIEASLAKPPPPTPR